MKKEKTISMSKFCDLLARGIKDIKQEIKNIKRKITTLTATPQIARPTESGQSQNPGNQKRNTKVEGRTRDSPKSAYCV